MMFTTTIETPLGALELVATDRGLRSVRWPSLSKDPGTAHAPAHPVLRRAAAELHEYFLGVRTRFDVALDPIGTPFQRDAWTYLSRIPYGETRTYAEQARAIGQPNAARAVGAANGRNPLSIVVPCHRVIGSNGSLTGFAGGIERKRFLLNLESRMAESRSQRPRLGGQGTIALTSSMTSA